LKFKFKKKRGGENDNRLQLPPSGRFRNLDFFSSFSEEMNPMQLSLKIVIRHITHPVL
jgi:hypothetical protein